ncbi:MAG TPA: YeeE/YedE family protein [Clostridia bacterium]|jgi:uncharacterized membrane protein YedE/YeeE|nr:YeeE/YedE family protein [Clostridia bacterium]
MDIPYWGGAILLGMLNIGLFYWSGKPWGITTALAYWGAEGLKFFGFEPETWLFFRDNRLLSQSPGGYDPLFYGTLLNIGVFLGAFMGSVVHKEFRIRWPRRKKQYLAALLGGLLMGYGARLAGGCSVGALVGGTASFSLHGWLFGLVLIPGAWLGFKLSQKLFYS